MNNLTNQIKKELTALSDPTKAEVLSRFFKTGIGEYGEGDKFLGITVPKLRAISKKYYKQISLPEIQELLNSPVHEERFLALAFLRVCFEKKVMEREKIFDFYLNNSKKINNWDLVDTSAEYIIGSFLIKELKGDFTLLKKLAVSNSLWERRISIITTFAFIKHGNPEPTLKVAKILLEDPNDLIQKAVGWMLREVGKRISRQHLLSFLEANIKKIPRTALRYSIEHFSQTERKEWLAR